MDISIIICTYNRAEDLRETLNSIAGLTIPKWRECELLVVDNASTDNTKEVIMSCPVKQMPVRYLYEGKRGQSNARNKGIAESKGEALLWTDDDVRLPENWIEAMTAPIFSGTADAVSGLSKMPDGYLNGYDSDYFLDNIHFDVDIENPEYLIGVSMAFHRRVLQLVPGFDPELGPGQLGFGDDALFSNQLKLAGFKFVSCPDAVVIHYFQRSRVSDDAVFSMRQAYARSNAYEDYHWNHTPRKLSSLKMLFWATISFVYRVLNRGKLNHEWELRRLTLARIIKERSRPRNYEKHGLARIR
jgi:glycosyltransferase involved in cell wall biosynthesis